MSTMDLHIFSKIDLKTGYYQIPMAVKDVLNTAFQTHQRLYEFLMMPLETAF